MQTIYVDEWFNKYKTLTEKHEIALDPTFLKDLEEVGIDSDFI